MCSLNIESASALLRQFERDWANLHENMKDQPDDTEKMTKKLMLLCKIRVELCNDKRLLRWYLLEGLQNTDRFMLATEACAEWEEKSVEQINLARFMSYNNWTLTTTNRWRLLKEAAGGECYNRWNFKHPLPPSPDSLHEIVSDDDCSYGVLRIGSKTHDLDWYNCK